MRIIDRGSLTGYISMNRSWAGFDFEDYYRASQITMGLLDEALEADLESEYLPEGGRRIGGLVDDHGIAQIARDLTAAEQEIKDELEGKTQEAVEAQEKADAAKSFQVVSGDMFSHVLDPVIRFTTKGITFNSTCISKLPGVEYAELLFNPVERMIVVRPCAEDHPNALKWDSKYKYAAPLCKIIYDSMGWENDYSFRVPCQIVSPPSSVPAGPSVLFFDLDNFIGRASGKKDEAIIQKKEDEVSMEEAILSWFNTVYLPLVTSVRKKHILHNFPKRTLADMYVWIVRYWDELKQKFGDEVPIETAVVDFDKKYKIPLYKRFINNIKRIILRREIDNSNSEIQL